MQAALIFYQKLTLEDSARRRTAIFEMVVWKVQKNKLYPEGIKYRAWLSENGKTLFGFDNHPPKGPHLHIFDREIVYVFRGNDELMRDIRRLIEGEGFIYES